MLNPMSRSILQSKTATSFIKEVLRLVHIVDCIVPREALIDLELPNGEIMPAGTQFTVDISVMAVKEEPWGSDSFEFNPDRYKGMEVHPYQEWVATNLCQRTITLVRFLKFCVILYQEYSIFGR